MRTTVAAPLTLALAVCLPVLALAADSGSLSDFKPISELQQGDGPSLFNGREANPADYPASFYSRHAGNSCTSTLVAPRALLTAAHCVERSGVAKLRVGGQLYQGTCTMAPAYPADPTADWAMCLMDQPVPAIRYERINADPAAIFRRMEVRLTGFGCTQEDMTGGNDGIYREGETRVSDLPTDESNDIITRTGAALCMGDSGGPAFIGFDAQYSRRAVIAVNSRTDVYRNRLTGVSFLSSLSTPGAQQFLVGWSNAKGVPLCGLSPAATNCRDGE